MTYPPPPGQPGPPGPPYQPGPTPPSGSRRGLVIGVIAAAVAALLCLGCGVGVAVYFLRNRSTGTAPNAAPLTPASPTVAPVSCGASTQPTRADTKAVGLPDFGKAARTGTATMRITTSLGPITITMDRARTPCTVASFQYLAGKKFFDQSKCHRLVTQGIFVLQCGDPSGTGSGGPDYQFTDENLAGAKYTRGVVAMANAGAGTNGSQFFIIFKDSALDPNYTPFGTVSAGLDIVDRVAAGGNDGSNGSGDGRPKVEITLQTLTVD